MCKAEDIALRSNSGELRRINLFNKMQEPQQGQCKTVRDLKERAVKEFPKSGSSAGEVQLVVEDKKLVDGAPLCSCGIKPETVVQMVRKVHGG